MQIMLCVSGRRCLAAPDGMGLAPYGAGPRAVRAVAGGRRAVAGGAAGGRTSFVSFISACAAFASPVVGSTTLRSS